MQDLTLVGLTEDKTRLVLVSDSGEEYTVPADARLRAALRGDHARLGQLEIQMDSALRPRDIQARIRAGETAEAVASAAQTTVEKIMGFAAPVLAERAHVADRAQRASIRRKAGDGPSRILADAVAERLHSRSVDPAAVEWDAWKREDGRWTLVADYLSGESSRHAEFVYDAPGHYVVAEDDEARWLVGEQSSRKGPQPRSSGSGSQRRLSAVSNEEELPLGADTIDMISGAPAEAPAGADAQPVEATDERTVDLSETAAAVREPEPADPDDLTAETGDADWMATQASERPSRRKDSRASSAQEQSTDDASESDESESDEVPSEPVRSVDSPVDNPADSPVEPTAGRDEATDEGTGADTEEEPAPKPAKKKSRRASVPSWDEIMFGGGRQE